MESVPPYDDNPPNIWPLIRRHKREIVLELFTRRGDYWEAIATTRKLLGVRPKRGLPPPPLELEMPEDWRSEQVNELFYLRNKIVPRRFCGYDFDWLDFVEACVFYDPPETQLREFADYGMTPFPYVLLPDGWDESRVDELPQMIAPPMVKMRDPDKVEAQWVNFYERFISSLIERYLEPLGWDERSVRQDVRENTPGLREQFRKDVEGNTPHHYIVVDEYTTEPDVRRAFQMLVRLNKRRPVGRTKRDTLIAVQCALLYDRHNQRDPNDRRQWMWTFEKLAEEFGLESRRAVKAHVELGRELLRN